MPLKWESHIKALWRSWLARRPVTAEVAGSSPVRVASNGQAHESAFRPGSSVGMSVRLKSGRSAVRSRPWPPESVQVRQVAFGPCWRQFGPCGGQWGQPQSNGAFAFGRASVEWCRFRKGEPYFRVSAAVPS
jgi:hypothetical protein